MPSEREARITQALNVALQPTHCTLENESHLHRGHVGATTGKGHFRLHIVAAAFAGKTALARHRMVYSALASLLDTDIHALSIEALSPDEFAR
jgi:BolA family transcriptional regulator, general stress-responsive regulator